MTNLEKFLNIDEDDDVHLYQAGSSDYQFESIHLFMMQRQDSRIVNVLYLMHEGFWIALYSTSAASLSNIRENITAC